MRIEADHGAGILSATLCAAPGSDARFVVTANAYGHRGTTLSVPAGGAETLTWDLAASGFWYDLSVTVAQLPAFTRRFAGRLETGRDSVSDPAMGGLGLVR